MARMSHFQKDFAKRQDKLNLVRIGARNVYYKHGAEHLVQKTLEKSYHDKSREEVVERLDNLLPTINLKDEVTS